jgi:adenylate cyclase
MQFRIGINLGDVIQEDDKIYGDGVKIAARLEGLAEPGGICISRTAFEHVESKLPYGYDYIGDQTVKNITKPIGAYMVSLDPRLTAAGKPKEQKPASKLRKAIAIGLVTIFVLIIAVGIWQIYLYPPPQQMAVSSLSTAIREIPNKPSIAVLPFENLSGEPDQEYFSDGITNDLITAISRFRELLVIGSNTIFTYKGKPVNIEHVGQELGVRYVLDGSVQKAAAKVRVNAQLIDAATGFQIWSERYDRDLNDIFAVQDEIVHSLVGKLAVKINAIERKRVLHKKSGSLEAYDYLLRGMELYRRRTRSENNKARQMFERAIEIDPVYASAYVNLGKTYKVQVDYGWTEFPTQALQRAKELAFKTLSLEESNADAYALLGNVYTYLERYDLAINQLNRAIELNPNDASSHNTRGEVMLYSGRVDDSIQSLETAYRFDPNQSPGLFMFLGIGYFLKGQYDKAINVLDEGLNRKPGWVGNHIILTAVYAQSGRSDDAKREAQEVLRLEPFFEIDNYGTVFRDQDDRAKIVEGLRKAGLN